MLSFILRGHRRVLHFIGVAALTLGLAACSTTGNSFDSSALRLMVVGETTLEQASSLLQAEPTDIYRQANGSALARWSHKSSLLTDAIYMNQELWLNFGSDGYFQKVVKSVNLPLMNTHHDGRRVGTPSPSYPPAVTSAGTRVVPVSDSATDNAIYKPAVSYPLPQ